MDEFVNSQIGVIGKELLADVTLHSHGTCKDVKS